MRGVAANLPNLNKRYQPSNGRHLTSFTSRCRGEESFAVLRFRPRVRVVSYNGRRFSTVAPALCFLRKSAAGGGVCTDSLLLFDLWGRPGPCAEADEVGRVFGGDTSVALTVLD